MSTIHVKVPHSKPVSSIRAQIGAFEEMLNKYAVKITWTGNRAELKNPAVSGHIELSDSFVEVKIELGMMAKMMGIDAAKLQGSITRRLTEALA
jgi:putative polyhydroxyalkanoate system protein